MTATIEPEQKKPSVMLALLLAFIPSVCLLVSFDMFYRASNEQLFTRWLPVVATLLAAVCVTCCFTSSFMLFRRKTSLAILFGVLFLLLNSVISLFFGCTAFVTGLH